MPKHHTQTDSRRARSSTPLPRTPKTPPPPRPQALAKLAAALKIDAEDLGNAHWMMLVDRIVGYHVITGANLMSDELKNGQKLVGWDGKGGKGGKG